MELATLCGEREAVGTGRQSLIVGRKGLEGYTWSSVVIMLVYPTHTHNSKQLF